MQLSTSIPDRYMQLEAQILTREECDYDPIDEFEKIEPQISRKSPEHLRANSLAILILARQKLDEVVYSYLEDDHFLCDVRVANLTSLEKGFKNNTFHEDHIEHFKDVFAEYADASSYIGSISYALDEEQNSKTLEFGIEAGTIAFFEGERFGAQQPFVNPTLENLRQNLVQRYDQTIVSLRSSIDKVADFVIAKALSIETPTVTPPKVVKLMEKCIIHLLEMNSETTEAQLFFDRIEAYKVSIGSTYDHSTGQRNLNYSCEDTPMEE